ncbi:MULTISPECIES: hypothetical protein [unclassified Pseudomonas]|uniref:hypothetical protein n=1 Tax=unclassified Pseudomonas TaxID=196821 RepID=UPI001B3449E2|nr:MULTISPECIES: hypothetical protein [unclassified Pseudomonas]MBP5947602.1 hypothetical protein [Pseudomonas sp. P9(2020)]MBZ9565927.1 hypothetical protein [Pseudomonas sp. P116]
MKEHHPGFQRFSSVWDALEDTPQDAARMRLLTNMMRALSRENFPVRPTLLNDTETTFAALTCRKADCI